MSLTIQKLSKIFDTIKNLKVGVIGDFAVDFYYEINLATNEKSEEKTELKNSSKAVKNCASV